MNHMYFLKSRTYAFYICAFSCSFFTLISTKSFKSNAANWSYFPQ